MDRTLNIRVDQDFMDKLSYLRRINQYKSISETIRRTVEKEYEKEQIPSILTMTKDEQRRIKTHRPFGLSEEDIELAEMYREQREAFLKQYEENRKEKDNGEH